MKHEMLQISRSRFRLRYAAFAAMLVCGVACAITLYYASIRQQVISELRNRHCLVMGDLYVVHVSGGSPREINDTLAYMVGNGVPLQLRLDEQTVSTETFRLLGQMKRLISISAIDTRTTDEDIKLLTSLPRLSTLALSNSDVTDRSLSALAEMRSLREVYLSGTKCTRQGVEKLRATRSDLVVHWSRRRGE